MNETIFAGMAVCLAVVIVVVQHFRFSRKYAGYKSIQDAIQQESSRLSSLKHELKAAAGRVKDEESKAATTIELKNAARTELAVLDDLTQQAYSASTAAKNELATVKTDLAEHQRVQQKLSAVALQLTQEKSSLETRIAHLLNLELREQSLHADLQVLREKLQSDQLQYEGAQQQLKIQLAQTESKLKKGEIELTKLMGRLDLYSRIDEYTEVGHFEMPNYLYDTSARYQSEIKEVRDQQRKLIREKLAVTYPDDVMLGASKSLEKKILDGQVQLMLSTFNVECDLLIEKVNPSNLSRTLEQIEKKAESLEKSCSTLRCGFNIDYIELKFEECKFQFEHVLKKKDEQEAQRMIREQMREEIQAQKQYEDAIRNAEREELQFTRLLDKAREHLAQESEQERALSLAKIHVLEEQLKEAQERSMRAKSMAEQTRRGFVYVISNIGAFGEGVYKIGLTRRLDPQERVDELSSASVPFPFDVHAMCYSEDAPALEHALHKRFSDHRVNAVNFRKEFFRVHLDDIQAAIEDMVGNEVDFLVAAKAEDYFQSKRLMTA